MNTVSIIHILNLKGYIEISIILCGLRISQVLCSIKLIYSSDNVCFVERKNNKELLLLHTAVISSTKVDINLDQQYFINYQIHQGRIKPHPE